MLQLELNAEYADVMERALYNGVISGVSLDGKKFFYTNPLGVWPDAAEHRHDHEHIKPHGKAGLDAPAVLLTSPD